MAKIYPGICRREPYVETACVKGTIGCTDRHEPVEVSDSDYEPGVWYRKGKSVFVTEDLGFERRRSDPNEPAKTVRKIQNRFFFNIQAQGPNADEIEAEKLAQKIVDFLNQAKYVVVSKRLDGTEEYENEMGKFVPDRSEAYLFDSEEQPLLRLNTRHAQYTKSVHIQRIENVDEWVKGQGLSFVIKTWRGFLAKDGSPLPYTEYPVEARIFATRQEAEKECNTMSGGQVKVIHDMGAFLRNGTAALD